MRVPEVHSSHCVGSCELISGGCRDQRASLQTTTAQSVREALDRRNPSFGWYGSHRLCGALWRDGTTEWRGPSPIAILLNGH